MHKHPYTFLDLIPNSWVLISKYEQQMGLCSHSGLAGHTVNEKQYVLGVNPPAQNLCIIHPMGIYTPPQLHSLMEKHHSSKGRRDTTPLLLLIKKSNKSLSNSGFSVFFTYMHTDCSDGALLLTCLFGKYMHTPRQSKVKRASGTSLDFLVCI